MVELKLNKATGKYEVPKPATFGRIYKVIDQDTGAVGYNYITSDSELFEAEDLTKIELYDTFGGWVCDSTPVNEVTEKVRALNKAPIEYIETEHSKLVARVQHRLAARINDVIDGYSMLDDMQEMYKDLLGRRVRPAFPGWE